MIRNALLTAALTASIFVCGCGRSAKQYIDHGNQLFDAGKYDEAALNYRNAVRKDPQSGEALYRLGLTLLRQNKASEAYQNLNRAVTLSPQNTPAKVQLANLALSGYVLDPSHPAALYDRARSIADELLAANANSVDGLRLKAGIALVDKKPGDAVDLLNRALRISPDSQEIQIGLAEALFRNGQPVEAEKQAKDSISRHPRFAPGYELLYGVYLNQQRWDEAEALLKSRLANNSKDAGAVLRLAGFYYRRQKPDEAEKAIQVLLDRRADFPQADLLVGDFHAVTRNWVKALADYQRGLSKDTVRAKTYQERSAGALAVLGRRDEALKALDALLASDANSIFARALKAQVLLEMGGAQNVNTAAALATDLAKAAPGNPRIQMLAGQALVARGDLDGAKARFQMAAQADSRNIGPHLALARLNLLGRNYPSMLEQADIALAMKPGDQTARLLRIIALTGGASYAEAKLEAEQLARDTSNARQVQMQLGIIALGQKHYAEAESYFRKLHDEVGSGDLQPLAGLVSTFVAENMPDKALQLVETQFQKAPDAPGAAALLVATAEAAGKPDVALAQLEKLAVQSPKSVETQIRIGELQRKQGNLEAALQAFQRARDLEPGRPGIEAVIAGLQDMLGRKSEAIASYRKALSKSPDNPFINNNIAYLLAETGGDLNEALKLATAGLQKAPNNSALQDTLAWIHIKRGDPAAARPMLLALTNKSPTDPNFRYHYAVALFQTGDRAGAKRELELALSNNPPKGVENEIRALLAQIP
jgi:tetratricopeptide (TPR) repeat protein